jgi:hypothetical protein
MLILGSVLSVGRCILAETVSVLTVGKKDDEGKPSWLAAITLG